MDAVDFSFGVTLDQVDQINRLVRLIAAQGDVIAVGNAIRLDERSLPSLGEAIYDAACAVHDIVEQVCEQKLKHAITVAMATDVKEAGPIYLDDRRRRALAVDPFARMRKAAPYADGIGGTDSACCIVLTLQGSAPAVAKRKKKPRQADAPNRLSTG